jgi:hypothetical protein
LSHSARETELQRKLHELGREMTNLKLAAHKEKIEYSRLEHKVEELEKQHRQQLEAKEQEKMQTIQELQKQLWYVELFDSIILIYEYDLTNF